MKTISFGLFAPFLFQAAATPPHVPPGKTLTDRKIALKAVVAAPVEEVFRRWTTVEGVESFFGEEAVVEAKVGGKYEVYFLPRSHPESHANSSAGARVLEIEPSRRLVFEWRSPPFAAHLNNPSPLWVEIRFSSVEGLQGQTIMELTNYGYGRGDDWDRVYEFFVTAWSEVLYRLDRSLVDPDFVNSWTR